MMKPQASKYAERADGHQVLPGEKRGGRLRTAEKLSCRRLRLFDSTQVESHQSLIDVDVVICKLFHVPAMPFGCGCNRVQVAEVSNPPVAMRDQMADSATNPGRIVGKYRVRVEERRRAVDEHNGGAGLALGEEVAVVLARRLDDQAIPPTGAKGGDGPARRMFILV